MKFITTKDGLIPIGRVMRIYWSGGVRLVDYEIGSSGHIATDECLDDLNEIPLHVISATRGYFKVSIQWDGKRYDLVRDAVIAWGFDHRGEMVRCITADPESHNDTNYAVLAPNGRVYTWSRTYPTLEAWEESTVIEDVQRHEKQKRLDARAAKNATDKKKVKKRGR